LPAWISRRARVDHELRQARLSRFGRVLALMTLGYVGLLTFTSIYVQRLSMHRATVPLLIATGAFAALWLLLRGKWTNQLAAQWWARNRHKLRSGAAGASAASAVVDARALTIARAAD
jgi:hypothetical protein